MRVVIGIVGEMAVGKTTVTDYIKEKHGAVSFRFSDMLRDILDRLYLEHSRENMQLISTLLRTNFGEDIMSKVLKKDVANATNNIIITEGVRRPSDVTYLKELPNFYLIALNAQEKTRFERITQRSENPDDQQKTWEQFQEEGKREPEQKIREIADEAQFQVDNNGNVAALYAQIDNILAQICK